VLAVSDWTRVRLVVLIGEDGMSAPLLLDTLGRSGYEGPFVLLAAAPSSALRRRAFLHGALDVIAVPADPRVVAIRLTAVLHQLPTHVSPPRAP
jgi:DNA-binding response OmpR family regulator